MDKNNEIEWKYIDGTDGYSASQCGKIKSNKGRILKPQRHRFGYRIVGVKFTDGTYKSVTVHSMVAAAWIGERPVGLDVHHLDHDKTNNAASNLVYMSRTQNVIESKIEAMSRGKIIAWCAMQVGQTVSVPQDYRVKRLADRVRAISKTLGRQFEYCAHSGTVTRTA